MAELKNTIINGSVRLNGSSSGWSYLDLDNKIEITPNASGNVVTGISIANNIITLTKGIMATGLDITAAINALDRDDSAVTGKYVSAVSQTDGIITVSRADLPTLSGGNTAETGKYVSAVSVNGHAITISTAALPTISTTSTGTGNVITSLSSSGHTITATKGITAVTSVKTLKTTAETQGKITSSLSIEGTGDILLHDIARTGKWADIIDPPEIDNNNQTIKVGSTSFDPNDVINIVGTANNITVTPTTTNGAEAITFDIGANVVTASAAMSENQIVTGAGTKTIKASGKSFVTTVAPTSTAADTNVPTELAVRTAINNAIGENDAMVYKGTLTPNGASSTTNAQPLPAADKGHTYKITGVGFIGNVAVQAGDVAICNTDGTAKGTTSNWSTLSSRWDFIQSNIDAATSNALGLIKLGNDTVIDGTAGKTYPVQLNASKQAFVAVPWTNTWENTAHTHTDGVGLIRTGDGGVSGTVSYKVSLASEIASPNASTYTAGGSSKFYAVQLDKNNRLAVYVPWDTNTNTTYTLGTNQGKIVLTPSSGTATEVQLTGTKGIDINTLSNGVEIEIGHSNTPITAKTTQALYPIRFDAQGHITGSGAAVTSLKNPKALTIGTSSPTTYDGSEARTINVAGGDNVSVAHSNGTFTVSLTSGSDTKVTQTLDTSADIFPILAKNTTATTTTTDTSRFASTIAIKPSTGEIRSQALKLAATPHTTTGCTMQYNATTQCLEFIFT